MLNIFVGFIILSGIMWFLLIGGIGSVARDLGWFVGTLMVVGTITTLFGLFWVFGWIARLMFHITICP